MPNVAPCCTHLSHLEPDPAGSSANNLLHLAAEKVSSFSYITSFVAKKRADKQSLHSFLAVTFGLFPAILRII